MNLLDFSLVPFPGEKDLPDIGITGTIGRRAEALSFDAALRGDLSEIVLPAPEESPERKGRLWEDTCLELFLGVKDSGRYWEFNLSPAGHWNVYRFTSYREGMREEPAFATLPFRVRTDPAAMRLSLTLDIGKIVPRGAAVEAAVCAVLRTVKGKRSHWAPAHPGPRPNFHRRDGFALILPAG
jgi:hypothetical protein